MGKWVRITLAGLFVALGISLSIARAERINQDGRILGPLPVVTAPMLFNTAQADAIVAAMQIMPITSAWNEDISRRPLLSNSAAMIAQISSDIPPDRRNLRAFSEMNFVLVPDNQPRVSINFLDYPDESDLDGGTSPHGRYPIPSNQPIESWPKDTGDLSLQQWQQDVNDDGGDRHAIIVTPGTGFIWETWQSKLVSGAWQASNGAKFDLKTNTLRPPGWTSGDAAGLPMFPATVRYDECERGMVEHALRLAVARTRGEFIYPATHYASSIPASAVNYPAMGQRLRLKAGFVVPNNWTKEEKAVLLALKKYGALVADNSGGFFSVSVSPDKRFPENAFDHLSTVGIDNFEVIQTTGATGGPRAPGAPSVSAGADQVLALPGAVTLHGIVNDPSGSAAVQWKLYSGPGSVSFTNATQANTTATFPVKGTYTLLLSAADGVHATAYDAVVVSVAPEIALGNISTRAQVGAGENALIGGFIIAGNISKKVIVRALGPSLSNAGVTGALADPTLELRDARGSLLFTNDNWKTTEEQAIRDTSIPPADDRESAIVASLPPGAYTAIVRGKNNTTGIGLVETYDLETNLAASKLANISTRGVVGTGNNAMIAGIIVVGSGPTKLLFRGIGPSLAAAGIGQPLHDPQLDLFNAQGTKIATNDNWKDSQEGAIQGTGIAPADDLEAAVLANLVPGNYTAIMTGTNGTSGIGVVEAYALP